MNELSIINGAGILEEGDLNALKQMQPELDHAFRHAQLFRTRTEMEVSVLNDIKHPTADSKYWQAVREMNVMFQETVLLSYEYRRRDVELRKLKQALDNEIDDLECELLSIEIEKMEFLKRQDERTAKDRIRELKEWKSIVEELKPQMKYSPDDVNEHQLEAFRVRFQKEAQIAAQGGSFAERRNAFALAESVQRQKLLN